jgi:Zn-finger nucleic acid-binding protein
VALERMVKRETLSPSPETNSDLGKMLEKATSSNSHGSLYCPDCHLEMAKDRFHPMIPVELDRCGKCGYVWLDAGEQALLLRLYRELATTKDGEVSIRRDKLDRLEKMYKEPLPGIPELETEIDALKRNLDRAANAANGAPAGSTEPGPIINRVADTLLSWIMPF